MTRSNFNTEMSNCMESVRLIAESMESIKKDLSELSERKMDEVVCDKKYPKMLLLKNLLNEIEDSVSNSIEDVLEHILSGVKDES